PTTTARVRVRDLWDSSPVDSSHAAFTINTIRQLAVDPDPLDIPVTPLGGVTGRTIDLVSVQGAVTISSASIDNPRFWLGRSSVVLPFQGSDTLGVWYAPQTDGPDSATVTLIANDPGSPHHVRIDAAGSATASVGGATPAFALAQNQPNPFARATEID